MPEYAGSKVSVKIYTFQRVGTSKTNQDLKQSPEGHATLNGYPFRLSSGGIKLPILIEGLKVFDQELSECGSMALA